MAEQKSSPAIGTRYNTRSNLRGQKKEQEQDLKNPSKQEDKDKGRPQDPQSDTRRQEDLDKGRPQDPQSNSIRQEDLGKGRPKDPQSITSKQEDLNKGSPQDPQSITSKQEDLNKGSPQDPQSITSKQEDLNKGSPQDPQSITSRQEDLDKGRLKDPQSITSRQEDLDKGRQQDPQSIAIRQEDLDKGSPQDSQSTSNRQEDLDKGSPQDPQSTSNRQEGLDKGLPQDPHCSVSQRDKDNTQSGQSVPGEPDHTAPQQDTVPTSGETKKWVCSCLLMSTFVSGSVLGGLLVIGLGLINPWSKTPDPVYNIVPSWGMCHINPQPVPPPLIDFNSSNESRIQEEMDKRETLLKAHLDAQLQKFMVDVKKDMNLSAEKAIEKRILELNASTENRIKDISETLSVRLNKSTENRLQDVFQEQSKMSDKVKTVQEELQQHKQMTEHAVAEGERQLKEGIRNISSDLNKTLDRVYNETSEKFAAAEEKRELVYRVIEHLNFMRADSWGMLVIFMGAMEVILYFYICFFLNNRRPRSTDARPSVPVAPLARVDRGDNNTLCIVYFVDRDLNQLRRWTDGITKETHPVQRIRTIDYVIASRDDIRNIPTCRLALVFVNPDERQLILEDEFHMGSTRRDTVQALRDRGVEVILIVYGDPTSRIRVLQDGSLFDPSLTQVTSHPVLRDLNSKGRIISVKESFSAYQKRHLVDTINQIFA